MFDIFAKSLSSLASFLFPVYASYKALKTSNPAELAPWVMYWVVLAIALLIESWTEWFLCWIPFYYYIRFFFLLYLVLPQTQGAKYLYTTYVHPWMEENEGAIEDFIASAHDRLMQAGIDYAKRVIELIKVNILGMPPSPPASAAAAGYNGHAAAQQPQSYTQALLARFSLPAGGWNGSGSGTGEAGATTGADFYSFLASAVSAAANAAASSSSRSASSVPREGETLIPANIRGTSARMNFIAAQRERLSYVLSALDREASQLQTQSDTEAGGHLGPQQGGGIQTRSMSGQSVASAATSGTSLSKSRSEGDFEKLDAESGAEDENGSGLRRRDPGNGQEGASGGGWMPWAWGGGANNAGTSGNGADRSTPTPGSE